MVTLVGKTSEIHVARVLETSLEENLAMIRESIAYIHEHGRRVLFDAEHFFDGYNENPEYTLACVRAAAEAGAEYVVLCDTNGGSLPGDIYATVSAVRGAIDTGIAIHCPNDADVAVANSIAAVQAGATQVQGTINGYGERCGNANLLSVIGNLKLKLGIDCVSDEQLSHLTEVHRFAAELANHAPQPLSALRRRQRLRSQGRVARVGHGQDGGELPAHLARVRRQQQARRRLRIIRPRQLSPSGSKRRASPRPCRRSARASCSKLLKDRESQGFQYEGAEGSFRLLVQRALPDYAPPFDLVDYLVVTERHRRTSQGSDIETLCEAMVKIDVKGEIMHTVAEGNGPVNALDAALRKGLVSSFPQIMNVQLVDYKVRVVEQGPEGTGAIVRVLVESTNGERHWSTVGASTNIIEASWQALSDSLEYALLER